MKTITCAAPYGVGGLGQHLAQIVEVMRAEGSLSCYYAFALKLEETQGQCIKVSSLPWLFQYTLVRFSPAWKNFLSGDLFDKAVATKLVPGKILNAFNGQALHTFKRARSLGYRELVLESATTHVDHVMRQQQKARQLFDWEPGWMNEAQRRKTLREYAMADTIYVASQLSHDTFLEAGVPVEKLRRRELSVAPRFVPSRRRLEDGIFRVVSVGSLSVMKGIPLLLEAFSRLKSTEAELVLVGGCGTRAMKRYLEQWQQRDPRIRIAPGDPLPHLHRANVCVHPSFTDGFGFSPMEALACGVPVIVTEDTGMKEHVREGIDGYVVPTGDWKALLQRLEQLSRSSSSMIQTSSGSIT